MNDKHALPRLKMNVCSQIFQHVNWILRRHIEWDEDNIDFEIDQHVNFTFIVLMKYFTGNTSLYATYYPDSNPTSL